MSTAKFTSQPPVGPSSAPVALSFPPNCENRVAAITLNAPEKLNALGWADYKAITHCLEWIALQPDILVTVFTGKGRYFSAGANVKDPSRDPPVEVQKADPNTEAGKAVIADYYAARAHAGQGKLALALRNHPKVMIAALNGPAVGLSAAILSHCDLVYAYDDFFFFTPFMSLALVAEGLTSVTFIKKMGLGRATEALLEGRKMTAADLKESGFITRLYTKPAGFDAKDKLATPPILEDVLAHVREKFLPPTANPFSLLYTKKLLNDAAYAYQGVDGVNQAELVSPSHMHDKEKSAEQLTFEVPSNVSNRGEPRPSFRRAHPKRSLPTSPAVLATSSEPMHFDISNSLITASPCCSVSSLRSLTHARIRTQ